jgi:catechol 2,3-dioxygenase-like lactoylglutathione lyase family enzyme
MHHVALRVLDLPRAEAFYTGLLGLTVLRRWPSLEGNGERSVWLDLGQGAFLALERANSQGTGKAEDAAGIHLLALRITPADRLLLQKRLEAAGFFLYHQTEYTFYVQDPEGNRVGLSHWPTPAIGV